MSHNRISHPVTVLARYSAPTVGYLYPYVPQLPVRAKRHDIIEPIEIPLWCWFTVPLLFLPFGCRGIPVISGWRQAVSPIWRR